jgi:RimJ/RimL family protein N-acetyltransferase
MDVMVHRDGRLAKEPQHACHGNVIGLRGDSVLGMRSDARLRDVRDDDLAIFFEHQRDPEANRMANFDARDRDAFMAHWAKILRDETVVVNTIEVEGGVAGNIVSWEHDGERDVGYWIGREHWGRGVATAALAAFLDELDTRPLHAHVATHNIGSIRVLEKCGFERTGEPTPAGADGVQELLLKLDRRG